MKKSSVVVYTFANINPINTATEGIMLGHYNNHYDFITDKTVPLTPAKGAKALHLVCFNRVKIKSDTAGR